MQYMASRLLLQREWMLGDPVGSGGFGKVYVAHADGEGPAVAKLVPKARGAQRELLFVDLTGVRNVIPIIDSGETPEHWVLIMPRADESLRQRLDQVGRLDTAATIAVLENVLTARADFDGRIVHRDVKPENILLLNGTWCLADFGISRYTEATTAPDTQKYALSPPYSAPERWRAERATIATDIYSVGVIAHELLTGNLPFQGGDLFAWRENHLHGAPMTPSNAPAPLAALIDECLYKAPAARPTPTNALARLRRLAQSSSVRGLEKLHEANRAEVNRVGERGRQASAVRTDADRRASLFDASTKTCGRISDALLSAVAHAAPSAHVQRNGRSGWTIRLGQAQLTFGGPEQTSAKPWGPWEPPAFEVIAHASLRLKIPPGRYEYEGRSHSLWYCDAREADRFQWFECAFMISPLIPRRGRQNPFALNPGIEAAKALWTGSSEFQMAWPFTPIQIDESDDLITRWADWFADGAQGRLQHPSTMPERDANGSWRGR
jgi:eukaryotic-like serine/threonine-protein kinase